MTGSMRGFGESLGKAADFESQEVGATCSRARRHPERSEGSALLVFTKVQQMRGGLVRKSRFLVPMNSIGTRNDGAGFGLTRGGSCFSACPAIYRCYALRVKTSYVYIMASRSRTLYTGVTNNLERRVAEHKRHLAPGFTDRYLIERLVYFETWGRIRDAIQREKQIKGWRRSKKVALIESQNKVWADLSEGWFGKADSSAKNRPQNDVCGDCGSSE